MKLRTASLLIMMVLVMGVSTSNVQTAKPNIVLPMALKVGGIVGLLLVALAVQKMIWGLTDLGVLAEVTEVR